PDPGAYPDPLRHNGGSRKPGFLADQEGGSRRPLPAPGKEHLLFAAGGEMSLLAEFLAIVADWRGVFPQQRTFQRAVRQALGSLVCLGRRCLTRIIWTNGGQNRSWSAEYFLHSRCQWDPQQLFRPDSEARLGALPATVGGRGDRRCPVA